MKVKWKIWTGFAVKQLSVLPPMVSAMPEKNYIFKHSYCT
ncbi:hypothetical protein MPF_0505 [Methanohalophilus portucalensis FDF-1]|uniref:Uncharacterized protein n=1 Tax=Methanohalophilus portucalensis FDF-1 TaxID=523843 RepID=A0A1L9C5D6_9EURY|nr:hypothetical protein MPF_0505 [Methanohalophilus portucalensis FDF-1]